MTTEQTAQQLELAAQILRTGYPSLSVPWPEPADPYAELKAAHAAGKVIQFIGEDRLGPVAVRPPFEVFRVQDLRIAEPDHRPEPAFQLPPPPPGMRWHREDGWKEGDLPQGYRPCVKDEREAISGYMESLPDRNSRLGWVGATYHSSGLDFYSVHHRTTRPLTFEHAGKTWTWHRPGDPMPCDGERIVAWLMRDEGRGYLTGPAAGSGCKGIPPTSLNWETDTTIIGWRYADEEKTDDETIQDFSDKEILQLRNLLNIFSTHLTAEEKLKAIATESLTWLARGAEAGRCAGAVMKIINPPQMGKS